MELGGSVKIMSLRVVVKIITMRAATDRRWVRTKQTEMGIMETNDTRVALNHSFESGTKLMSSILNTNPYLTVKMCHIALLIISTRLKYCSICRDFQKCPFDCKKSE